MESFHGYDDGKADEVEHLRLEVEDLTKEIDELQDRVYSGRHYPGEEAMLEDLLDERDELIEKIEDLETDLELGELG